MEDLVQSLKECHATNFAFYIKSQFYHWNVEGPDFAQYHAFFADIYEDAYSAHDQFAEEIRALGSFAPGSLSRFSELAEIADDNSIPDCITMSERLLNDANILIGCLTKSFELSEQYRKYGLSDFLAGRIDAMNKWVWQLRSTVKKIQTS